MRGSNYLKLVPILVLALFITVQVGGFFAAEHLMMDKDAAQHCPFMGAPALCDMGPLAHVAQWQQMFTTTVAPFWTAALSILLALVLVWYFLKVFAPPLIQAREHSPQYNNLGRFFDPLRLAFARGILHTKAF